MRSICIGEVDAEHGFGYSACLTAAAVASSIVRRTRSSSASVVADHGNSMEVLLENLAGKASATLALLRLLADNGIDPGNFT